MRNFTLGILVYNLQNSTPVYQQASPCPLSQTQHIFHVVKSRRLAPQPFGGADGAVGEDFAAAGFVGEFKAFAGGGVDDGVVADDVAAAEGVEADFAFGAFADVAVAAVGDVLLVGEVADFGEDFDEAAGGAAGGVDLLVVVHFHDFEIEGFAEDFGGLACEPEEGVDADAVVASLDDGDGFGGLGNEIEFGVSVTSGADDEGFAVLDTGLHQFRGEGVVAEIDDAIAGLQIREQGIAQIDGSVGFCLRIGSGGGDESVAHAASGTGDEKLEWRHWD